MQKKYCINEEQYFCKNGAIWCLNVTILFTFAKPYLNFVYHEIYRICQIILVLRVFDLFYVVAVLKWLVLNCKMALADMSTKALRDNGDKADKYL
jgi:hypothetical protein